MGRNVKCKICGKEIPKEESYCISRMYLSKKGKNAGTFQTEKKYYCSKEEYEDNEREKMKEVCMWNELYSFIRIEVLKYSKEQTLPPLMIARLQDLRNGTVIVPKVGRVKQSKEGYPYEVILETFKKYLKDINFWIGKKHFKNEYQKINYIMAIIDGNINDVYLQQKQDKKVEQEQEIMTVDLDFDLPVQKPEVKKQQCLMDLLNEEDL